MLFLFILINSSFSQQHKPVNTSFFDKNGDLAGTEDALYYRESTDTVNFYRSYYAKDSSLYFEGQIIGAKDSTDRKNIYAGRCVWYYQNGNKKTENNYTSLGTLSGICKEYYENGNLKKQVEYEYGKLKGKSYLIFGENGSCAEVLEDDFIDNRYNWQIMKNDTGSSKVKIGGLELISKKKSGFLKLFSHSIQSKSYSTETVIHSNYLNDTMKAGLIFAYKNPDNYCYFSISKSHCYIGYFKEKKDFKLVNKFFAFSLKPGERNTIKIINSKNKRFYYANDEIIFSSDRIDSLEKATGLFVEGIGIAMFDKLIIKEYKTDLITERIYSKNGSIYELYDTDFGIQSFSTGIILNNQGLILTNSTNFKKYNQIIVEAYANDTLNHFFAEVILKDESVNLALLKINNLHDRKLTQPAFSFFDKSELALQTELQCFYFTNYANKGGKPEVGSGRLKSKARFENLSNFFSTSIPGEAVALGSPVFTMDGELLGIINDNATQSNAVKINSVNNLLFVSRLKFEKLKKPSNIDIEAIKKNCVLIKVK